MRASLFAMATEVMSPSGIPASFTGAPVFASWRRMTVRASWLTAVTR